jgi:hypothetical protein
MARCAYDCMGGALESPRNKVFMQGGILPALIAMLGAHVKFDCSAGPCILRDLALK